MITRRGKKTGESLKDTRRKTSLYPGPTSLGKGGKIKPNGVKKKRERVLPKGKRSIFKVYVGR